MQVCSPEDQEVMSRGSKKSEKLYQHLMRDADKLTPLCRGGGERQLLPSVSARMQEGLQKAQKHKDLLIEFDKTRSAVKFLFLLLLLLLRTPLRTWLNALTYLFDLEQSDDAGKTFIWIPVTVGYLSDSRKVLIHFKTTDGNLGKFWADFIYF